MMDYHQREVLTVSWTRITDLQTWEIAMFSSSASHSMLTKKFIIGNNNSSQKYFYIRLLSAEFSYEMWKHTEKVSK